MNHAKNELGRISNVFEIRQNSGKFILESWKSGDNVTD